MDGRWTAVRTRWLCVPDTCFQLLGEQAECGGGWLSCAPRFAGDGGQRPAGRSFGWGHRDRRPGSCTCTGLTRSLGPVCVSLSRQEDGGRAGGPLTLCKLLTRRASDAPTGRVARGSRGLPWAPVGSRGLPALCPRPVTSRGQGRAHLPAASARPRHGKRCPLPSVVWHFHAGRRINVSAMTAPSRDA